VSRPRILVAEDDGLLRRSLARALRSRFGEVDEVGDGAEAVRRLARAPRPFDVVVSDLRLPSADGFAVLAAARERDPRTRVLLLTAHGSVEAAVEAMRRGAADFVEKPAPLEQIEVRIARALEHAELLREVAHLRRERAEREPGPAIVGSSPAFREALDLAERVAPSSSSVLLLGETGTGKELLAGFIHARSRRRRGPFIKVNCAALPETLLESELFGHERGAFTGAERTRRGRFELADGGTLLLDEVADLSPATQARLLRVLQDGEFQRVGGTETLRVDVRILSATNRDLERDVAAGRFREDLFFRLNVIRIDLPPLRERPEDLLALADHFLAHFAAEVGRPLRGFTAAARERILAHRWPGNVRELRNAVERAVLLAEGEEIGPEDLLPGAPGSRQLLGAWRPVLPPGGISFEEAERGILLAALERTGFVQKDAAELLGISRRKLNYMVRRLGIRHPSWRRNRAPGPGGEAVPTPYPPGEPVPREGRPRPREESP